MIQSTQENMTLSLSEMQMIHWPDNMLTYCPQLKTVFSNDAFGQHIVNFNLTDEGLVKHIV